MSVDGTVGGGQKDGSAAGVVDGDVGFEAGSATGLFDDVRGGVDGQDVNPAETDACGLAGVVESLLADEIRRKDVDGLRGGVLCGDAWAAGPEQVLEPDRHIGCGGVEAGASGGGFGGGAGSLVVGADEQMAALLGVGEEGRVLHMERVEGALGEECGVWLVGGGLEGIAEEDRTPRSSRGRRCRECCGDAGWAASASGCGSRGR